MEKNLNVLSLFDGISCGQLALKRAKILYNKYYASEIDKLAISVANHNFPKTIQLGSVTDVKQEDLPKIDILLGGSPCQGFSFAGKQLNFKDPRSKLFFEYVRLKKELNPTYFLLENNPMKKEYSDVITKELGVQPIVINSRLLSAQNRKRLYWTNIPNVEMPDDKNIMLEEVVGKYNGIWVYPRGFNRGGVQSYQGKAPCITTSGWQHNFFIQKRGTSEKFRRKFSIEEAEQLQTLPIGYTDVPELSFLSSNNQRYIMVGNGWTVDVVSWILSFIKKS